EQQAEAQDLPILQGFAFDLGLDQSSNEIFSPLSASRESHLAEISHHLLDLRHPLFQPERGDRTGGIRPAPKGHVLLPGTTEETGDDLHWQRYSVGLDGIYFSRAHLIH